MKQEIIETLATLKQRLNRIDVEFKQKIKENEEKIIKFKSIEEKIESFIKENKNLTLIINVGGEKFETFASTLLSRKDTLFYVYLSKFILNDKIPPKEIFIDRNPNKFQYVIDFLRTGALDLKRIKGEKREIIKDHLEFFNILEFNNNNRKFIDLEWDYNLSKPGQFQKIDEKTIQVNSNTCYTHFVTNKEFTDESFQVELEVAVTQSDNYLYIGIVNENYNFQSNCMCCNPPNSWYLQCNGTVHSNSTMNTLTNSEFCWNSKTIIIGIRCILTENEKNVTFYLRNDEVQGPFIMTGNKFRVVAGHCNTGNGKISIIECLEYTK